ncbi:flagellar motor switch protein FliN [Glutamicibacter creatinolyticus]|uniref:flagellar motor switch protein FliN n=1 Tax=Glutamicibacter creatinolyticus TaxID=162496 RepID=UPI0033D023E7
MNPTAVSSPALHSTALYTSAAEALAGMLPTTASVSAVLHTGNRQALQSVASVQPLAASFVGQQSADVVLAVADEQLGSLAEGDARLSTADILRPALEAATGVLGAGVLSTDAASGTEAILLDAETVCFELRSEGKAVGFFALRLREHTPAAATGTSSETGQDVAGRLGRINNVEMALTVEIGRTRMSVRDVLGLEPGAVVELDRSAGAPADILLNGRLIAQGEVVVMDQDYGVRITRILDVDGGPA